MPSTYTSNLGIEKPASGEQSGTWGTTVNINSDILDEAINGVVSITLASAGTSGSPTVLTISEGSTSDARAKFIEFVDGGDLGANAFVRFDPNTAQKQVTIRNSLTASRTVTVFQGNYDAARDFEIPNGKDVMLNFSGGGTTATVTQAFNNLLVESLTVNNAIDGPTGASSLDELTDVDTSSVAPTTGDVLAYDGANFVPATRLSAEADTLDTVTGRGATTTNNVSVGEATTTNLKIGSWEIKLDTNDLRFVYNGTDVARITTTGEIIALGDITASGAP